MIRREAITNLDDSRLAPFRSLRAQFDHLDGGVFVAEGEKVVRRMLAASSDVISVLLSPKWEAVIAPLAEARPESVTLFVADTSLLEQLTGFRLFQGLLGLARVPRAQTLSDLEALPWPQLLVAFDGLSSAENLGVAIRNVTALGGQAVIVGETSAHPYLRRAVRNSMGAVFRLPYVLSPRLVNALNEMRLRGIRCVAAHPHSERTTLWETDLTIPTCLVFGSEGHGVRPEVLAACDAAVRIPMANEVDSLNVANSVAVFLGEAQRQRQYHQIPK
ncbi:MAG TPA: RNA methyltransferase [Verrucomicrobiota bacterium]|nr:RNA methyltransferase [Verrucomicrobiota bacterium]